MEADVILNENKVLLKGKVEVTADEGELEINGALAGYSFHDRTDPKKRYVLYATEGKAFLWQDGFNNILTIEGTSLGSKVKMLGLDVFRVDATHIVSNVVEGGNVHATKLIVTGNDAPTGSVLVRWHEPGKPIVITKDGKAAPPSEPVIREMDLVKTIQELQVTIEALQKRVVAAESKLGIVAPIIIKR